ncbi:class I SAM-dependent methyltransferase [Streptomyces sp. ASQP_92]|uniref:N5-glutamine methyltransferase family protein n=1 Tax=Streptomyces sp. ASQP_92 TaxID=2979116 RepID=UPI0021BEB9CC|nr:class I SAM-dependent methyltransferase [Streptomyces sp. ASQP_92]MCT9094065.1 class I SAM-dependent methyltransferase [Streptomyces sp. ASQP_92]
MPECQHVPQLPQEQTDLIRAWHELGYETARHSAASGERLVHCMGLDLMVPPEVLAPAPAVAEVLGRAVLSEAKSGRRVLDLGTGSGINGILAAGRGCEVLAVDINPHAVAAAAANAVRNGVGERVLALESDVFSAVEGTFDLIVCSPPFRWFAPRDHLEAATTDEGYRMLRAMFASVADYLAPKGCLLFFFGSSGDLAFAQSLMDRSGLRRTVVDRLQREREGRLVEYIAYRLSR